jgi:hypothetical protein
VNAKTHNPNELGEQTAVPTQEMLLLVLVTLVTLIIQTIIITLLSFWIQFLAAILAVELNKLLIEAAMEVLLDVESTCILWRTCNTAVLKLASK